MVLLIAKPAETVTLRPPGFNSSMVRLIVLTSNNVQGVIKFQFLYGTIDRQQQQVQHTPHGCFNSSMVRLIALTIFVGSVCTACLNTYIVRLIVNLCKREWCGRTVTVNRCEGLTSVKPEE